jgi:hypothetical protein
MPRRHVSAKAKTKEEAPMKRSAIATASRDDQATQNPKQPQQRQTAKEIIAANVKSLIEQLEVGHSDALTAYLAAMSRFHNYSFVCYAQHRKLYVICRTMLSRDCCTDGMRMVTVDTGCGA